MKTKILATTASLIAILIAFPTHAGPRDKAAAKEIATETAYKHHPYKRHMAHRENEAPMPITALPVNVSPRPNAAANRQVRPLVPMFRPMPAAAITPRPLAAPPALVHVPMTTPAVIRVPSANAGGVTPVVVGGPIVVGRSVVTRTIETPVIHAIRARWEFAPVVDFIAPTPDVQAEAELLREAYVLMAHANHDYLGHRWQAMNYTRDAGRLLGVELHGDGRIHQTQDASDQLMQDAEELLKQAESQLAEDMRLNAAHQAGLAMGQVAIALNVR